MATERLSMRSVKEVLRQKWVLKKSHREVARSLGISTGAVGSVMGGAPPRFALRRATSP